MSKKINVKINSRKQESFRTLVEELIADGFDIALDNGQTSVRIYLPESMVSLCLDIKGTWTRE